MRRYLTSKISHFRFKFNHTISKLTGLPAEPLRRWDARKNLIEPRERLVEFFVAGKHQSEPLYPVV